jgi:hypothetical protein
MSAQPVLLNAITEEIASLPTNRQAEILDFVLFLKQRELTEAWDSIPDDVAYQLRAEFGEEDRLLAESTMQDYFIQLKHEDED